MELYNKTCISVSKLTTRAYSTSFSLGVRLLNAKYRDAIYGVYGFVRFADEIVDSFQGYNQEELFFRFKEDTYKAINDGISTNPILQSFQLIVNKYNIDHQLIESFLKSMEWDLRKRTYNDNEIKDYIYGSAEVVGLMCLRIFYHDDGSQYEALKIPARKLGEAFQKVNFLRDIKADYMQLGRVYFPGVDFTQFTEKEKKIIEDGIQADFNEAFIGIILLKREARLRVDLAYRYYLQLFNKIKKAKAREIANERYHISNTTKATLLAKSYLRESVGVF